MAMVPMMYPIDYFPGKFQASIVVYATDGTVAVSHAGVEMVGHFSFKENMECDLCIKVRILL